MKYDGMEKNLNFSIMFDLKTEFCDNRGVKVKMEYCLFPIIGLLIFLCGSTPSLAQLDAPGALSDIEGCAHHTCTWVPGVIQKTFKQGDFDYTVEVNSKDDSGGFFVLRHDGKELLHTPLKDLSASTSVVWSDNNKSFAVTWSDGGAIGNFHVRVFHIERNAVFEWPATRQAFESFKTAHWCKTRGDNIQAYKWLPDSRGLVLVLSVYPTGDCGKDLGHTEAEDVPSIVES
jgi:hypothetical protein